MEGFKISGVPPIRWLRPKFLCMAWAGGKVVATVSQAGWAGSFWSGTMRLDSPQNVSEAVENAKKALNFAGNYAVFVLAHPALVHRYVIVPRGPKFLQNRVLAQAVQEEESAGIQPAWASNLILRSSGQEGQRAILYLLPRDLFNAIETGFQRAGLRLMGLYPHTIVVGEHLNQLFRICEDQVLLLCSAVETARTLVVAERKEGILFVRTLYEIGSGGQEGREENKEETKEKEEETSTPVLHIRKSSPLRVQKEPQALAQRSEESTESLGVEIRRTCLYIAQKFGLEVERIFLAGQNAEKQAIAITQKFEQPVQPSPFKEDLMEWVRILAAKPLAYPANFITPEKRMEPERRKLTKITLIFIGIFCVGCLIAGIILYREAASQRILIRGLQQSQAVMATTLNNLKTNKMNLLERERFANLVLTNKIDPTPLLFLAYLGTVIPEPLVINHLEMIATTNGWSVTITGNGVYRWGKRTYRFPEIITAFQTFTNRLASAPLSFHFDQAQIGQGRSSPLEGWLTTDVPIQPQQQSVSFEIKGKLP